MAWNCEASHWMIVSELFLGQMQQLLEQRVVEIVDWDHKPSVHFSNIHWEMAFWDIIVGHRRHVSFSGRDGSPQFLLGLTRQESHVWKK